VEAVFLCETFITTTLSQPGSPTYDPQFLPSNGRSETLMTTC